MANDNRLRFVLPPGRIIHGSVTELRKTDNQNRPLPEDKWNRYIGVAVRKDQAGGSVNGQPVASIIDILTAIYQFGCGAYAQNQAVSARAAQFLAGDFSWKIKDGDVADANGKLSEHAAGCFVFHMQTTLPIKTVSAQNVDIDPAGVKRGYFVDVAGSTTANGLTDGNAGIYLNPEIVRLLGFGPEIYGGPDANTAFAGVAPALPPGASAVPVGAGPSAGVPGGMAPGLPGVGASAAAPVGAPGLPGAMGGVPMSPTASHGNAPIMPPGMAPAAPAGLPGMAPAAPPLPGFHQGPPGLPGVR